MVVILYGEISRKVLGMHPSKPPILEHIFLLLLEGVKSPPFQKIDSDSVEVLEIRITLKMR